MRKTIFAMLCVALLIMSVVPALAESGPGKLGTRMLTRDDALKERYDALKTEYQERKENYTQAKLRLEQLTKEGLRAGRMLNETDRIEVSRVFLNAAAERIETHLERLQTAADENNNSAASADLQVSLDAIVGIKADIAAATTLEQLKAAGEELRKVWNDAQKGIGRHHGLIFTEKMLNLLARIENVLNKVDARVDALAEKGYNVSSAQAEINESAALIAQAKQKAIEAQAEFRLVTGTPGQDEHFKKGHQLIKEADELLREAHSNLKDFLKDASRHIRQERREDRQERRDERRQDRQEDRLNRTGSDDDDNETDDSGQDGSDDINDTEDDSDGRNESGHGSDDDIEISVNATVNVTGVI